MYIYSKKRLFNISLSLFFVYCQASLYNKTPYYIEIEIKNKKYPIPSLKKHKRISNLIIPFKYEAKLITNKNIYEDFLFHVIKYFRLEKKTLLFWSAHQNDTAGESYFNENGKNHIIIPKPPYPQNQQTFIHELGHIALSYKKLTITRSPSIQNYNIMTGIRPYFEILAILLHNNEWAVNSLVLFIFTNFIAIFNQESLHSHLEELLCDTYSAVTTKYKEKNLALINLDIEDLKKETQTKSTPLTLLKSIKNTFLPKSHPTSIVRLQHLELVKKLLLENNQKIIAKWIKKAEHILLNQETIYYTPILYS